MHPEINSMLVITHEPIIHFINNGVFLSILNILKSTKKHNPPIIAIVQCVYLLHSISIKQYKIPLEIKIAKSCFSRFKIHHRY